MAIRNANGGRRRRGKNETAEAVVGLLLMYGIYKLVAGFFSDDESEQLAPKYETQVQGLAETLETLRNLERSVVEQKGQLEARQKAVDELKGQADNLSKIVQADQAVVEAIFLEQEARHRRERWIQRAEGVGLGMLSSALFALIVHVVRRFRTSNKLKGRP